MALLNLGDLLAISANKLIYSLSSKKAFFQWLDVPADGTGLAVLGQRTLALYTYGKSGGFGVRVAELRDLELDFACSKLASSSPLSGRLSFELLLTRPESFTQNTRVRIELNFESKWQKRLTLVLLLSAFAVLAVLVVILVFYLFYLFRRNKRLEHYDRAIDFWVFQYSQERSSAITNPV